MVGVRVRLNSKYQGFEADHVKQAAFLFGVDPLLKYVLSGVGKQELSQLGREELGNQVFELYKTVASRTRLVKKYAAVLL